MFYTWPQYKNLKILYMIFLSKNFIFSLAVKTKKGNLCMCVCVCVGRGGGGKKQILQFIKKGFTRLNKTYNKGYWFKCS